MIQTLIEFHVQPEKTQEFESIHRKLVTLMSAQPGCIEIKAHRAIDKPLEYMVYGTWESKEAWVQAHQIDGFKKLFKSLPIRRHTLSRNSFFEVVYTAQGSRTSQAIETPEGSLPHAH
jgi:quinol monooxygenase YgiN